MPAHAQLAYLLECTAYVGELSRMIQFKEKGRGRPRTRASLFTYPCLMAADILLYGATRVPVGGDQDQHVELARDLAIRFNRTYGETFVVPELHRAATAARVRDLAHPTAKMSKSDAEEAPGVIRMLDSPDRVRRAVLRAVTDSGTQVRVRPRGQPRRHQPAGDPRRLHRGRPAGAGRPPPVVRRPEAGRRGRRRRGAGPRPGAGTPSSPATRPRWTGSWTRGAAGPRRPRARGWRRRRSPWA